MDITSEILTEDEQELLADDIGNILYAYNALDDWKISFIEGFYRFIFVTDDDVYIDVIPDIETVTAKYDPGVYLNIGDDCTIHDTLCDVLDYWKLMYKDVALEEAN